MPARRDGRTTLAFHLTGGERHDPLGVGPLFERGTLRTGRRGRPRWKPEAVTADRAYSATRLLDAPRRERIAPVIPSRSDRPGNPDFDRETYRERNLVERLVGELKRFRRVATRYARAATRIEARRPLPCHRQLAAAMVRLRAGGGA